MKASLSSKNEKKKNPTKINFLFEVSIDNAVYMWMQRVLNH